MDKKTLSEYKAQEVVFLTDKVCGGKLSLISNDYSIFTKYREYKAQSFEDFIDGVEKSPNYNAREVEVNFKKPQLVDNDIILKIKKLSDLEEKVGKGDRK